LSIDAVITKRYGNEKRSHSLSYTTKKIKFSDDGGAMPPPPRPP